MKSQVIIYTGEGKGKTTAALGLAVAAAARGQRVKIVQFLKGGGYTGELYAQQFLAPNLEIRQFGHGCVIAGDIRSGAAQCIKCGECFRENRRPEHGYAEKALACALGILSEGQVDLLVLDEISHALRHGLVPLERLIELITTRPDHVSLVLTGRYMPPEIIALADSATECLAVKHPIHAGIDARRGTEY